MDLFKKCFDWDEARNAKEAGFYPYFIPLDRNEGTEVVYEGRHIIMCGSNNYLGLTTHPKVRQAAIDAIKEYGTSCTGSRFLNGNMSLIEQAERELAEWVDKESALIFSTGMQVNLGTISALVGRGDYVILDKDDHASIYDGAMLSSGRIQRYNHNDIEHLEEILKGLPENARKLLIVDGLFSMEGDVAPLDLIVPLCEQYGIRLMVDDAHGMGVLGGGRGTGFLFGLNDKVDLVMSTFSKSFASIGGFVAGEHDVIDYVKHHARSLIFSASIPPANTATVLAALQVMRDEPERIQQVIDNGKFMREGMQSLGFDIGESCTPVVPIIIGDNERTFMAWRALFDAGVFVNPVIAPATSPGRQLLRTSYMATHTREQLEKVLDVYARVGKMVGLI
jgi:8-amino-7-oxononanoate synthase